MVTDTIKEAPKYDELIPTTPAEKIVVLKRAKEMLEAGHWAKGGWRKVVNAIEGFCIYGAIEQAMGIPVDSRSDEIVSECSITTSLFNALPEDYRHDNVAANATSFEGLPSSLKGDYDRYHSGTPRRLYADRAIAEAKVEAIQEFNDREFGDATNLADMIAVIDTAIEALEKGN